MFRKARLFCSTRLLLWATLFLLGFVSCGGTAVNVCPASSQQAKACSTPTLVTNPTTTSNTDLTPTTSVTRPATGLLPGEQIWKNGISSYLFGTNDTGEWSVINTDTSQSIQQSLKAGGFTLMRDFFDSTIENGGPAHPTTDADLDRRIHATLNSGMTCLGVLADVKNITFNEHVVSYLGNKCNIYEFGNEADINGIDIATYLQLWNQEIPLLRTINPDAKFGGPATYYYVGGGSCTYPSGGGEGSCYMRRFLQGVKASEVLPDFISYHDYACYNDTESDCLQHASNFAFHASEIRRWMASDLGINLPVGVTEWNFDPGNPPPSYGDDSSFITAFTNAAIASMITGHIDFANQFDAASYAGYGHLDMIDTGTNQPKPQYTALKKLISQYKP